MPLYKNYTLTNAIAFNGTTFACISLIVFLASSQPFYLAEVLNYSKKDKIGSVIGKLGFVDELLVLLSAPLIGTLCDEITALGKFSGVHVVVTTGFATIGFAFICYGAIVKNLLQLFIFRAIFATGVSSIMTMVTVMFTEISNSDFSLNRKEPNSETIQLLDSRVTKNGNTGKLAGAMGVSAGLGAIFAVSFFLTLPTRIQETFSQLSGKQSLQLSYILIGILAYLIGSIVYFFLYRKDYQLINEINNEIVETNSRSLTDSYRQIFHYGIQIAKKNRDVQLSYFGSFVARSTAVSNTIFVPLLVFQYYFQNGLCASGKAPSISAEIPTKENCKEAYVFAAILTGVGQTVALFAAPIWAFLIDYQKIGSKGTLQLATFLGGISCLALCIFQYEVAIYDPKNVTTFLIICALGISQIGTVMSSMSLLSKAVHSTKDSVALGSVSGLYSLCGGLGILLVTILGGQWSDVWIKGPFLILGLFNGLAFLVGLIQ